MDVRSRAARFRARAPLLLSSPAWYRNVRASFADGLRSSGTGCAEARHAPALPERSVRRRVRRARSAPAAAPARRSPLEAPAARGPRRRRLRGPDRLPVAERGTSRWERLPPANRQRLLGLLTRLIERRLSDAV